MIIDHDPIRALAGPCPVDKRIIGCMAVQGQTVIRLRQVSPKGTARCVPPRGVGGFGPRPLP